MIVKEGLRRGLSPRTIKTYCSCVERFFRRTHKDPYSMKKEDILAFLDGLIEKNAPGNTTNVYVHALKFFYERVLHRRLTLNIPLQKKPRRLPEFLNKEEVAHVLRTIENAKHRLLVSLLYGAGLRVSEVVHLRIRDFDFTGNYGWVRQGKGRKDRLFILPQALKEELLAHIAKESLAPDDWLFQGWHGHFSTQSVRQILKKAWQKAQLQKRVHPHMFRHSFATHLIQNGYSVLEVQPLLGHSKIETTMIYLHLAAPQLLKVQSPYDALAQKSLAVPDENTTSKVSGH